MKQELDLNLIFQLIAEGKISELEAERLINAATRLEQGVPTLSNKPSNPTLK